MPSETPASNPADNPSEPVPPAPPGAAPQPAPLTPVAPVPPSQSAPRHPNGSDKLWSILSHLSTFVGLPFLLPLVVWLAMKGESAYVAENAKEALNFHLSLLIYTICLIPLAFFLLGIPLMVVMWLASLVLAVVAAVKSSDGECYRYPMTIRLVK